jgi:hypothetical protein
MVFWDVIWCLGTSVGEENAVSSILIGQWTEILITSHVASVGTQKCTRTYALMCQCYGQTCTCHCAVWIVLKYLTQLHNMD